MMRHRVAVAVVGVVAIAVALPMPAAAAGYSVDLTCKPHSGVVGPDEQDGSVRLSQPLHAGDTVEVRYHDCRSVYLPSPMIAWAPGTDLPLDDEANFIPVPSLLPARDGAITFAILTEPTPGDVIAEFHQGGFWSGDVLVNGYRPMPRFTILTKRDPHKCTSITVTLRGVPASENLEVKAGFKFGEGHYAFTEYTGTGGTGDSWAHTFSFAHASRYPIPRRSIRLGIDLGGPYFDGTSGERTPGGFARVAACG